LAIIGYHLFTQTPHNAENVNFRDCIMDRPITPQTAALPNRAPRPELAPDLPLADVSLMQKAKALEASFLAEMLGHAGLGAAPEGFGGGIGEEQFASFLRAEQAKAIVEKGGLGLAQQIFESLKQRTENAP
jgi:peptidoglycan hydrolase FlgJ